MTDPNYTHIEWVIDCSGSMDDIADEMSKGYNKFIADQKAQPGKATAGLTTFSNTDTVVYEMLPLDDVRPFRLIPTYSTALIDAACKSIDRLGAKLRLMADSDRPSKVIFGIITDGIENASRSFRKEDLQGRILRQSQDYQWEFIFPGANIDVFAEAGGYGIPQAAAVAFRPNVRSVGALWHATSENVSSYRGGQTVNTSYSSAQRSSILQEDETTTK